MLDKSLECPLESKEIKSVNPKGNQSWIFIGRSDAAAETPILWPPDAKSWLTGKDRCWERLKAGGEGDERGWDGWMTSLTQWTWVSASSGSWWWTGRPGLLQSMGFQRVRHNWATEVNRNYIWRLWGHNLKSKPFDFYNLHGVIFSFLVFSLTYSIYYVMKLQFSRHIMCPVNF